MPLFSIQTKALLEASNSTGRVIRVKNKLIVKVAIPIFKRPVYEIKKLANIKIGAMLELMLTIVYRFCLKLK